MAPYTEAGKTVYYYGDAELEALTDLKSRKHRAQVFPDILKEFSGANFKDPEFKHIDDSVGDFDELFDTADPEMEQDVQRWRDEGWNGSATWLRVAEVCKKLYKKKNTPCFNCGDIGKTIARNDIQQGSTGDCWFLCSISAVSMVPELISFVVPSDNKTNDAGVYHFRFWYQGAWVDIVVDDYLPCVVTDNETFTIGTNFYPNNGKAEFWPLLLEKAYAKLNGNYSHISGNCIMYALENLIGGFGQFMELEEGKIPEDFFETILRWIDRSCVLGAGSRENKNKYNIVGNHAYSVTGARVVTTNNGEKHNLLRLRNPWGKTEWSGNWSDGSSLWKDVSEDQKTSLDLINKDDGEFLINYDDFKKYYVDISACWYYSPESVNKPNSKYHVAQFQGEWSVAKGTAGGWDSVWENPQYLVEMSPAEITGLLIVGTLVREKLWNNLDSGYSIRLFPVSDQTKFDKKYFESQYDHEIYPEGETKAPGNSLKSFSVYYRLKAGKYLIVPSALQSGVEHKICVRVVNEGKSLAVAVDSGGRGRSERKSRSDNESASSSRAGSASASRSRSVSASGSSRSASASSATSN